MTDFNQKTHDTDVGSHGGQSRQMMDVFENQEFGSIRLLQEAGKTFFCASDVAKALGYGKYISAYACDAKTCDEEFLLSKRQYEHITGRTQAHDVIAYQIRQSFKPGEITPEEANKVGYETAM